MAETISFPALIWSMAALGNSDGSGGGGGSGGTVSITINSTTTIPAGEPARVENIGTDTDLILNFYIPQGVAGTNGTDGLDGTKWFTSTQNPGTKPEGIQEGDYVLYSNGAVYQLKNNVMTNLNMNMQGSRWIVVNSPPGGGGITSDLKEGDIILYNDGSIYRITGGRLVNTNVNIKGAQGVSPTITVKEETDTTYILTITDANGSYDTPNLKGSGTSGDCDPYLYAQKIGYTGTREQFDDAFLKMLNFFTTNYVIDGTGEYVDTTPVINGNEDLDAVDKVIFDGNVTM